LNGVLDTQLVYEHMHGEMLGELSTFLAWCGMPPHPNKQAGQMYMRRDHAVWGRRPLPAALIEYAVSDVLCLLQAFVSMGQIRFEPHAVASAVVPLAVGRWGEGGSASVHEHMRALKAASRERCQRPPEEAHRRRVWFDEVWYNDCIFSVYNYNISYYPHQSFGTGFGVITVKFKITLHICLHFIMGQYGTMHYTTVV
jgi:hypothetical protein